jgi:hypothetical protein
MGFYIADVAVSDPRRSFYVIKYPSKRFSFPGGIQMLPQILQREKFSMKRNVKSFTFTLKESSF